MPRRIVILGDVHDHRSRLDGVLRMLAGHRAALALLVGDLGEDPPWVSPARETERTSHDASVRRVIATVGERLECPVRFVPGNHDLPHAAPDIEPHSIDGRSEEVAGLTVAGLGGAGPARFGFPYEWDESQAHGRLEAMLDGDSKKTDILVCHAPPSDSTLDRIRAGAHVGSSSVRRWIERARPALFTCGHIHQAWGVEWIAGVPCLNAGALGEPYGQQIAWLVDWKDDGPSGIRSLRRDDTGAIEEREWHPPRDESC